MKFKPCLLLLFVFSFSSSFAKDYNIKDYGAIGDGQTLNTSFIQKAIDDAASSGGRVVVPAGVFITGSLRLKSNVDLFLKKDAVLKGSSHLSDYERNSRWYAIILVENQKNISISGEGTIDGNGDEVVKNVIRLIDNKAIVDPRNKKRPIEFYRPQLIEMVKCSAVSIKDITLKDAACWVQTYKECEDLIIDQIKVESTTYWNNDGIDIVDCKNVIITNSFFNAADDGICLKSENPNLSCENIIIRNCKIRSSASGVKLGTASAGGFKKIKIGSIYVYDTYRTAIALEIVDGGILEDVEVSNITGRNVGGAIFIRLGDRNKKADPGILRNIYIHDMDIEVPLEKPDKGYNIEGPPAEDIYPHNLLPSSIVGLPGHPVQKVVLENIKIQYGGGADKTVAFVPLDSLNKIPEYPADYPEFSMFGELPAWGFYVRHAEGIELKNVWFSYKKSDFRPALVFDDVRELSLNDLKIPTAETPPAIVMKNVSGQQINQVKLPFKSKKAILNL
jgi:polygalacturonase